MKLADKVKASYLTVICERDIILWVNKGLSFGDSLFFLIRDTSVWLFFAIRSQT